MNRIAIVRDAAGKLRGLVDLDADDAASRLATLVKESGGAITVTVENAAVNRVGEGIENEC